VEINELRNDRFLLNIPDDATLSSLVAARLDLPISQYLLRINFKRSTIERCWEDQLRLKSKNKEIFFFFLMYIFDLFRG